MSVNAISDTWLAAFLGQRDPVQTTREAAFVATMVPRASRVLDLACGYGRHAALLGALGYDVVGLDRDARVLPEARRHCAVVQADMRQLPFAPRTFRAVVSLWQSFGYFTAADNVALLRDLREILAADGVLILDLYNRDFFETVSGQRTFSRGDIEVQETTVLNGDRLRVRLTYGHDPVGDVFEWQVFTPATMSATAAEAGLRISRVCCDFDPGRAPQRGTGRVQYLLTRA